MADEQNIPDEGRIAEIKSKPENERTDEERIALETWEEGIDKL
jgi:hypothetical protein